MSDFDVKEKRFEEDIEDYLTHHGGYTKGDPKKFNRESGLEEDTFVEFIKTSQPKKWERYVKIYAENSEKQIIERFKREVKTTNLLNVMRHGFMDRGIKFYPIFWKPETSLNETTQMQYDANILHCTRLHPHNISQKTAIMLEHFMNVTRHKIGGRAKAMVVTPSRLHAVRYVQEFKRQIKEKGLNDLEVLVAFSGEVKDNDDVFTEEGMNKDKEGKTIKEKALPETFHADDYGILVVAEKYQTGFDEPLLHTMFVDKKLSGVKAVQTLSRLNRTTRGKVDTFVLDFVNSAEDIKASFEPFYEETVLLEETDPNVVYDMKNTLDDFRVYQKSEVDKFADIFYQNENQSAGDLGKLQGQLRPAIDRYEVLEVEKQDIFKSTLASFNRVYAYITQVCRLFDKDIHRFSIYSKFLYTMLPKGHGGEKINIDDKVLLEYYKLEKDFEGPIELESTEGGYTPISGDSGHREPKKDPLTVIIDKINEKYGTHFTEMDKVLVQMENDYAKIQCHAFRRREYIRK